MSKRFIDQIIPRPKWRKFSLELKLTWNYLWMNCDNGGVYFIDVDLFEFENGFEFPLNELTQTLSDYIQVAEDKLLLIDFIRINYGKTLKPEYNPHKPVLRSVAEHGLEISSLGQASFKVDFKLVDEDEDEDIEEDEDTNTSNSKKEKIDFEVFWNAYEHKKGSKPKAKSKWDKFSLEKQKKILEHIPIYKINTPDVQYRKQPMSYLNSEIWESEDEWNVRDGPGGGNEPRKGAWEGKDGEIIYAN